MFLFQYIKTHDWKSFRTDWKEYKELQRYCHKLKRAKQDAFLDLVCDKQFCCNNDMQLKCVRRVSGGTDNIFAQEDLFSFSKTEYCAGFLLSQPKCMKEDCPYASLYNKYRDEENKCRYWLDMKKRFWYNKSVRSK